MSVESEPCARVYVAGPVTGMRDGNRPAFEEAARALRASGCRARIPHDDVAPDTPWTSAMKITLMAILAQADGLAMLEGWERSWGARLELNLAWELESQARRVVAHAASTGIYVITEEL